MCAKPGTPSRLGAAADETAGTAASDAAAVRTMLTKGRATFRKVGLRGSITPTTAKDAEPREGGGVRRSDEWRAAVPHFGVGARPGRGAGLRRAVVPSQP